MDLARPISVAILAEGVDKGKKGFRIFSGCGRWHISARGLRGSQFENMGRFGLADEDQ